MLLNRLHLSVPIIQAPMAGGITSVDLIYATLQAGGLGSLGAGYMKPEEIRSSIQAIQGLTNRPFNVNLFVPSDEKSEEDLDQKSLFILESLWKELSEDPFPLPLHPPSFEKQALVLLEEKVPIFSFTFGIPDASLLDDFRKQGTFLIGTATSPEEAILLEKASVDAIVCQGEEAGGHRGSFLKNDRFLPLDTLLSLTSSAVSLPLIAAGGIMDKSSLQKALRNGAQAAQIGTAFLGTKESGAHPTYKQAIFDTRSSTTRFSKAFTGKQARAVENALMKILEKTPTLSYPNQHYLTNALRKLAAEKNRPDLMSIFAGKNYSLCEKITVQELMKRLWEA